jgi:hypothetical protein
MRPLGNCDGVEPATGVVGTGVEGICEVMVAVAEMPAEMLAIPTARTVARPPELTLATLALEEAHVTWLVISWVDPSL